MIGVWPSCFLCWWHFAGGRNPTSSPPEGTCYSYLFITIKQLPHFCYTIAIKSTCTVLRAKGLGLQGCHLFSVNLGSAHEDAGMLKYVILNTNHPALVFELALTPVASSGSLSLSGALEANKALPLPIPFAWDAEKSQQEWKWEAWFSFKDIFFFTKGTRA